VLNGETEPALNRCSGGNIVRMCTDQMLLGFARGAA
jgi:hypothetical protein